MSFELRTKASPSVWDWQFWVRTSNFLHISSQINVWISQNSEQDRQLFQLSPEHWWCIYNALAVTVTFCYVYLVMDCRGTICIGSPASWCMQPHELFQCHRRLLFADFYLVFVSNRIKFQSPWPQCGIYTCQCGGGMIPVYSFSTSPNYYMCKLISNPIMSTNKEQFNNNKTSKTKQIWIIFYGIYFKSYWMLYCCCMNFMIKNRVRHWVLFHLIWNFVIPGDLEANSFCELTQLIISKAQMQHSLLVTVYLTVHCASCIYLY